ncbi:MAG: SCO family protein [Pseudomonadales bacterium]|nr:SCO family protein [Pseudomonadales bacterium]MBL6813743.1 SCO family protein [Pseudomonadales bacterium]
MSTPPLAKTAIFFIAIFGFIVALFSLAVRHHDGGDNRVQFRLKDHNGETLSQDDLGGRHLLVFFGFTSCHDVCPTQMAKLTQAMAELDNSGHGNQVRPVFISVDPERDTPEKVAQFLTYFDNRFVGLTGSRMALKSAANSFKTLFADFAEQRSENYQITHSSVVFILDPFSRIVDYMPSTASAVAVAEKVREVL